MNEKEIYKPNGNRVLILPMEITEEDLMVGSIKMVDTLFQKGTVRAVGHGEYAPQTGKLIPMRAKEGRTVIFRKDGPFLPIRIGQQEYRLMREADIECFID